MGTGKICFGKNNCYEVCYSVPLVRNEELSGQDREFMRAGLRRAGGEPTSTFRTYLVRKEGEPTLRDIYEGMGFNRDVCKENTFDAFQETCSETTEVTEEAARMATLKYLAGFRMVAQHIVPGNSMWLFLLLNNAALSKPWRARCDEATSDMDDCLMDKVPDALRNKKIIILPDGYTTSTRQYIIGDGVTFMQSGDATEGEATALLYKDGGDSWHSYYRVTEEFLGIRCPVEENRNLPAVLHSCFSGSVAARHTIPVSIASPRSK